MFNVALRDVPDPLGANVTETAHVPPLGGTTPPAQTVAVY
jgi:hypothetical protein